jgi:hypothetical protein
LDSGAIVLGGALVVFNDPPFDLLNTYFGYLLKLGPNGELYGSIFEGQTFEDVDPDCSQLVEVASGRMAGRLIRGRSTLFMPYPIRIR